MWVAKNWISGGGGGGGVPSVVQLQDVNTVHGGTVFWLMLCVLVLGSTSVDVPLIFTQEWEINDPRLIKIKVNAVYFFVCKTLCNFDKSLTSVKFFGGGGCFEKKLFEQLFWCSQLNCLHFYVRNMLFSVLFNAHLSEFISWDDQFTQINSSICLVWITFQWNERFVLENSSVCLTVRSDKRFSLMSSSVFNSLVGWPSHFGDQFSQLNTLDRWTVHAGVRFNLVNSSFWWTLQSGEQFISVNTSI